MRWWRWAGLIGVLFLLLHLWLGPPARKEREMTSVRYFKVWGNVQGVMFRQVSAYLHGELASP